MTLILSNEDIEKVLTMDVCLEVLELTYLDLAAGKAVIRPRSHTYLPVENPEYVYLFKTMDGGISRYDAMAIRLSSDMLHFHEVAGHFKRDKVRAAPGNMYVGMVLLFRVSNCEPLAIMQDSFMQKMRVGATYGGLASKYMAREDAHVLGLFGSGWQASSQVLAQCAVRDIREIRVFSPTREHRQSFARHWAETLGIKVHAVEEPRDVMRGADIVAAATNARETVIFADWLQPGMHVTSINSVVEGAALRRADILVRHGGPPPNNYYSDEATAEKVQEKLVEDRVDFFKLPELADVVSGKVPGRTSKEQITMFGSVVEAGLGLQFAAVGARVYELAKEQALGVEVPTEWFLQKTHS